ncbi:unnamed protein product [Acanthoscelides obtectus]|uniref:Uncharacterized protein n=1 Tax=Acanthoscelides obtectus TaxID=200917 RepID=A0A9P0PQ75_ACAOB|nr:unnamed protein product [Acanthoscelides obtectus]CAK1631012.1 hypothetical protein AOBTE_LOCUS6704 [Acanthoscelides obtectus]
MITKHATIGALLGLSSVEIHCGVFIIVIVVKGGREALLLDEFRHSTFSRCRSPLETKTLKLLYPYQKEHKTKIHSDCSPSSTAQ